MLYLGMLKAIEALKKLNDTEQEAIYRGLAIT